MSQLRYDTGRLQSKDRAHLIHPWQSLGAGASAKPVVIVAAEGMHVVNSDGERLLDGIGGLWCVNIGHGREEIAQAIADQARRLDYFTPFGAIASPPGIELASRLAFYAPGDLRHVFFTTGGSTAVDSALRFVQFYFNSIGEPQRRHIITRELAYHGSTYLAASVSGKPSDRGNLSFISDIIHHLPAPNPYRRPDGMDEAAFCQAKVADLENKILELWPENVACFIAEPVMASGGVIVPPAGYHRGTLEVCRKYGVLYISDEVVTGFGRLGRIFASEPVFGIVPDIITCAKGLTSGYVPLGAFLVSDRLYARLDGPGAKGQSFANGFTYSAHPIACAAALTSLAIIEREHLCGHVREVGPYFIERLKPLSDLPIVGEVRGTHLMACVECVRDKSTKEPMPADWQIGNRIIRQAMSRGLIVRPMAHLVILSPPLIISRSQVDEMADILRASILAVADELRQEGLWSN
jgi:putrescine---pyruvate transaminase